MSRFPRDPFERLIAKHYESLKPEVLATVRGKLAVDNLHPDPADLDAAYNAAWHALYEKSRQRGDQVRNLGGWLATTSYRRAIDDVRRGRMAQVGGQTVSQLGYEPDLDADITHRQRYHQWLVSVRLRLNAREQQAVSLCMLHAHSRREASEIMGIDIKRLDKIMVAASKKLDGLVETIDRGDWCEDQRSLIKAYALGLHEEGGERHELAIRHLMECPACASYVRRLRGLAAIVPAPALVTGAAGAGGGLLSGLGGLIKGAGGGAAAGGAGTAAGGGGATVLSGLGAKSAALCVSAACAAGGVVVVVEEAAPQRDPEPPSASASASSSRGVTRAPKATRTTFKPAVTISGPRRRVASNSNTSRAPRASRERAPRVPEIGIEPQATATSASYTPRNTSLPSPPAKQQETSSARAVQGSEFGIEGP